MPDKMRRLTRSNDPIRRDGYRLIYFYSAMGERRAVPRKFSWRARWVRRALVYHTNYTTVLAVLSRDTVVCLWGPRHERLMNAEMTKQIPSFYLTTDLNCQK